jgi:endonuclease/exonuclease/phosphatase family metal-dependent hydrolase
MRFSDEEEGPPSRAALPVLPGGWVSPTLLDARCWLRNLEQGVCPPLILRTMSIKVVAWNMQHQKKEANWDRLLDWAPIAKADLYLLCEAVPVPEHIKSAGLEVEMNGSTKETHCPCEGDKCDNRRFSTAVASSGRVERLPSEPERRAGTWIACSVDLRGISLTAIALYGLGDDAYPSYWQSTEKAVSEVIPILKHEEHGKHVLLGGDFNILAGAPPYGGHEVLARIEELGLVDCLKDQLPGDRYDDPVRRKDMDNCQCGRHSECIHTRTFLKKDDPDTPHQDDYLFASAELADRLEGCHALPLGAASPSDHAPIVATFNI